MWIKRLTYARVHGARRVMLLRASSAHDKAVEADANGDAMFAASLRGKAKGYREAADILRRLESNHALPTRRRERR